MIKTGDRPPVDEWVNNIWPDSAKKAIKEHIQNYSEVVKFNIGRKPFYKDTNRRELPDYNKLQ